MRTSMALIVSVLPLLLSLNGCVSTIGSTGSTAAEETESFERSQPPPREHLFDTPEDTVMDTPWFTVSSVTLEVQWTQPETVIVVPADSAVRKYLSLSPIMGEPSTTIPGNRFLFNLGIMTDGVPPFTPDPDRYRYPELYE